MQAAPGIRHEKGKKYVLFFKDLLLLLRRPSSDLKFQPIPKSLLRYVAIHVSQNLALVVSETYLAQRDKILVLSSVSFAENFVETDLRAGTATALVLQANASLSLTFILRITLNKRTGAIDTFHSPPGPPPGYTLLPIASLRTRATASYANL